MKQEMFADDISKGMAETWKGDNSEGKVHTEALADDDPFLKTLENLSLEGFERVLAHMDDPTSKLHRQLSQQGTLEQYREAVIQYRKDKFGDMEF